MAVTWDDVKQFGIDYVLPIGGRIVFVLVLFLFGRAIAKAIIRTIDRMLERHKADQSLRRFVGDIAYVAMLGAVVVVALDTLGVKTTAVVAVLGAAGLAVGLALQGSLSNFAAGVMIILLRPYKVHDLVTLGKYVGRVEAIKVFHTVLITGDHRQITIPNGQILAQPIENLTVLGRRRVDLVVTIGEVADIEELRTRLVTVVAADTRIEAAPAPSAEVAEVNETGAKLFVRAWTTAEAYIDVMLAEIERLRASLKGTTPKFTVALAPAT